MSPKGGCVPIKARYVRTPYSLFEKQRHNLNFLWKKNAFVQPFHGSRTTIVGEDVFGPWSTDTVLGDGEVKDVSEGLKEGKSDGISDDRSDAIALGVMLSFGVEMKMGTSIGYLDNDGDRSMDGATVVLDSPDGSCVHVGSVEGTVREGKSDEISDGRRDGVVLGVMLSFGVVDVIVGAPVGYRDGTAVVLVDALDGSLDSAESISDSALGWRDVIGVGAMLGEIVALGWRDVIGVGAMLGEVVVAVHSV